MQVRPEYVGEIADLLHNWIHQKAQSHHGFRGGLVLTNREANRVRSVSLWETVADLEALEMSGELNNRLAGVASRCDGPSMRESFEVSLREGDSGEFARVRSIRLQPEMVDKTVEMYQAHILPAAKEIEGFRGALVLTNRRNGHGLGITFWQTLADVEATQGLARELLSRFEDVFNASHSQEICQTTGYV